MWKILLTVLAALLGAGFSMPGGLFDVDINNEGVQMALNFSVEQHNNRSNDVFLYRVAEVVKVQAQVVAGMKYYITANMTRTNCKKQSPDEVCVTQTDPELAKTYQCTFHVWSRPWLNDTRLQEHKCGKEDYMEKTQD